MTPSDSNQFQYIDGQLRSAHAALFDRFAAANAEAVQAARPMLDLAYGPHPRQTFDLFPAASPCRGVIAYFHAGYWQSRDKSGFHFIAPPLAADGFDVAVVNYLLSPETPVAEIAGAAAPVVTALAARCGAAPLVLVGHSAGAQIAVDIAVAAPRGAIAGIVAISGVFDLVPLLDTTVNDKLGLDHVAARAASPIERVLPGAPPCLFAVGEHETAAFQDQTARMAGAWAGAGNVSRHLTVAGADHFSILSTFTQQEGALRRAVAGFDLAAATT